MHTNRSLARLARDLPRTLRWSSVTRGTFVLRAVLTDASVTTDAPPLALLERLPSGELRGTLEGTPVRVVSAGRRHPRLRLTLGDIPHGVHMPDLAGFAPDWSGLGPVETGDGTRYTWTRGAWAPGGALIRDAAGAGVVRIQREGGVDEPGALIDIYGTLPDGHAAALTLLGWAVVLHELAGPGQPLVLRGRRAELGGGEWM